jgi:hypothetical protein
LLFFARRSGREPSFPAEPEALPADNFWKNSEAEMIDRGEAADPRFRGNDAENSPELKDLNEMMWTNFCYYRIFPKLFSRSQCAEIVDLHQDLQPQTSKLSYLGGAHRDSQLYWVDTQKHPWINENGLCTKVRCL